MTKVADMFCWPLVLLETPDWAYKEWAPLV